MHCALILRRYPFSLHFVLSSHVRLFNVHPKNQCVIILGHYRFNLCFMLSSWNETHSVYALCSHPRFVHSICTLDYRTFILRWYRSACALRSHQGFNHSIYAFCHHTLILRRHSFSLHFVLSFGIRSFNIRILSSYFLSSLYKIFRKNSKNSIKMSLHPLPPKVQRVQCILWTFAFYTNLLIVARLYIGRWIVNKKPPFEK